jgi:thiol-disulfide isomerase/thioredoxin
MLSRAMLVGACVFALGATNPNGSVNKSGARPEHRAASTIQISIGGTAPIELPGNWRPPKPGDSLSFQLAGLDGKQLDTTAFRGKLLLVDFWATTCGDSMGEMAHLSALQEKYKDQGLVIVGVPMDADRDKIQAAITDKKADWPEAFDTQQKQMKTWALWGAMGTATGVLVSPDGKMLWRGITYKVDDPIAKAMAAHSPKVLASAKPDAEAAPGNGTAPLDSATKTDSAVPAADKGATDSATAAPAKPAPVEVTDDVKAKGALGLAQSYQHASMNEKAKAKYQEIIDKYPNTPSATSAKQALEEMGKS